MACIKCKSSMALDTTILKNSKPVSLPTWVKPVGIAQPVNVNGTVATKTAGAGTGIFSGLLNIAQTAFSTFKEKSTSTAQTNIADQVGSGSNTFVNESPNGGTVDSGGTMQTIIWVAIAAAVAKYFKLF